VRSVEAAVSRLLFWGGLAGVVLMVLGLTVYVARGPAGHLPDPHRVVENRARGHPADVFVSVEGIRRGLDHWPVDPVAVIALGIVLLLLTPVLGLAVAAAGFWLAGDRRYATIAALVLAAVVLSFVLSRPG